MCSHAPSLQCITPHTGTDHAKIGQLWIKIDYKLETRESELLNSLPSVLQLVLACHSALQTQLPLYSAVCASKTATVLLPTKASLEARCADP